MDDDPITLQEACTLYPAASFKVATLRAEADRGRLHIFLLGRRYHTTKHAMQQWVQRCQDDAQRQGFTSIRNENSGLSATERASSAQAALRQTVQRLKSDSPNISGKNTNRSAGPTR